MGSDEINDELDYAAMIDAAMRGVVRQALLRIKNASLPGDHHFYISFKTDYPGVGLSSNLRTRYPEEMTIVLQHQFWDFRLEEEGFTVMLSFGGVPEKLVIPFAALTAFADPSVKFGLQFHTGLPSEARQTPKTTSPSQIARTMDEEQETGKIVSLDAFRKK